MADETDAADGAPFSDEGSGADDAAESRELFTRLCYFGMAHLGMSREQVALCPFGLMSDFFNLWREERGLSPSGRDRRATIDDVIPVGI